ncbi:MAG: pyruvate dehydrogenase (acetyl-transferring) E1 component subunit alpha [Geobacter sp.]|nr:pyruvate dehydrogenase (acetyl-transferring) E1 component subunit alpha [Geobacter sp.]
MSEKVIATCAVRRLEILDESGGVDTDLMPLLSDAEIRRMYDLMVLTRTFDERALALQREGRLGTYPPVTGQEAAQVGSALALQPRDWVFPSFREMGVHLALGFPMQQLFQYWAGDGRGLKTPDSLNIFPICVSVGTHIPHAVGAAMAARYRRDPAVAVAYFGDGATSKGDFHEGFNMAGVFRLPVVFICQNNQWAISVPLTGQTAAGSLAQKAFAYGFEGVQVDGNDIFAVYRASRDALEKARGGGGPTFIECLTYRMADHTTADDASRYRSPEELATWSARDPILRLERFMAQKGIWNEAEGKSVKEQSAALVDDAVRLMEALPLQEKGALFDDTVAFPGQRLTRQMKEQ